MRPRVSCPLDVVTILEVQFEIEQRSEMDFGSVMNQVLFICLLIGKLGEVSLGNQKNCLKVSEEVYLV